MTSTTSYKNSLKQAWSIFKWTLKSSKAVWIIYLSLLAFSGICFVVLNIGVNSLIAVSGMAADEIAKESAVFTEVASIFYMSEVSGLAVIFSFVLAIMGFGYLHNKRMTDMFGAMPVSRRTLYFSKWASSIIIPAIPMLFINLILNIFVPKSEIINEGLTALSQMGVYYGNTFESTFRTLIAIVACVSFFGLLSICCGKKSDAIISTIVIMGAFPVAMALLQFLPMSLINGYVANINIDLIVALSPVSATESGPIWYWLLFIGVCLVLSFFLVKNRKSESAQSHFAYRLPFELVKIIVSFAVGITIGYLFLLILGWNADRLGCFGAFWLGMILGSIVTHTILQIVLNHGFKGYLKGLISYGAMIGTFAVVFLVLATGFVGYESYVPKAEDVKSVTFTDGATYMVNGENIIKNNYSEDKKLIEKTVNAHKAICDEYSKKPLTMFQLSGVNIVNTLANNVSEALYSKYSGYSYDGSILKITYTLNNGTKVNRVYTTEKINKDSVAVRKIDAYNDLINSTEFRSITEALFILDENYCKVAEITAMTDDDFEVQPVIKDKEQIAQLIQALRKDAIADEDRDYMLDSYDDDDVAWIDLYYGNAKHRYDNYDLWINVNDGYKNTIKVLENLSILEKAKNI
ncbi:MAG: hypothetical protein PUD53_07935 [Oscillospiraceae bacterium]|nr:hypothetical protein [Oscillospiraceae bacterium]